MLDSLKGTVLITGAFGNVGSRLVAELRDCPGVCLHLGTRRRGMLAAPASHAQSVTIDLSSVETLRAACDGVRHVVHLAAADAAECEADPERAFEVNTLGTFRLLQAAREAGVERFVYFSTARVYGEALTGTITETTIPRPTHPYAITHRAAEDLVLAARARGELDGIVVRLTSGFGGAPLVVDAESARGEVNRWKLVANDLCRQAVTTRRLVLRTHGLQRRDFMTQTDVARAVVHLLRTDRASCGDGLFNLGGDAPWRVIDCAERIAERCETVLGFRPSITRPPAPPGSDVSAFDYRIDKLKATGFVPLRNLDDEIDAMLRLCRTLFQGTAS